MRRSLHKILLSIAAVTILTAGVTNGGLENGSFETIDNPSRSELFDVDTPAQWEILNYTAVLDHFTPSPASRINNESSEDWDTNILDNGLYPVAGNSFVLLSTGDIDLEPHNPGHAQISQEFQALAGETLYGSYFFGTFDYGVWCDYATINLIQSEDPNKSIPLVIVGINATQNPNAADYPIQLDVEDHDSTQGWQSFEYIFTEETAGAYLFQVDIYDTQDNIYRSYIAIDGLGVCVRPEYGDINLDCKVDMLDFTILADDWLCDCSDPLNLPDPNDCSWTDLGEGVIKANLPGDINEDKIVDYLDLQMITEKWMWSQ